MLGLGLPDTLELNEMLPPLSITITKTDTCTDGANKIITERKETFHTFRQQWIKNDLTTF